MMPQDVIDILTSNIDTLWVIDCAILVFIMQAGFMCMETGLSRHKNSINVALKNAADFGVSVVIFWIFGFGLMFGTSYYGFFGTDLFFFKTNKAEYMTYFVFQAMFVATAATIISGAVAERMKFNGSRFYAFTDGLSESLNDKGQEIGIDGSIDIIETNYNKDTTQQLNDITKMVVNTSKNQKLTDDLTVISIGK